MKKKSVVAVIAALALTAVLSVGGTLAYLSSVTETKTNTFSSSKDLKPHLEEEFDSSNAENYTPGKEINKQPVLSNDAESSEAIYGALSLNYKDMDGKTVDRNTFESDYATINHFSGKYTLIAESADGKQLYMYNNQIAVGAAADPIFTSVTVNAGIKEVTTVNSKTVRVYDGNGNQVSASTAITDTSKTYYYKNADGTLTKITGSITASSLPNFYIDVKGYAVQTSDLDAAAAKTQLIALANSALGDAGTVTPTMYVAV